MSTPPLEPPEDTSITPPGPLRRMAVTLNPDPDPDPDPNSTRSIPGADVTCKRVACAIESEHVGSRHFSHMTLPTWPPCRGWQCTQLLGHTEAVTSLEVYRMDTSPSGNFLTKENILTVGMAA